MSGYISITEKRKVYYSKNGWETLQDFFSKRDPDEMNFVLFSTSGVHGSYVTIEEIEAEMKVGEIEIFDLTFLIVQPRILNLHYGNVEIHSQEQIEWLKSLREKSTEVVKKIGY